jgi:flagellar basal body-associated protein FliL
MKALQNNKTVVIAIVVFILAIVGYNMFLSPSQTAIDQSAATQGVGNDVVALYKSLQSVTLDQTIFSTVTYKGLVDFSVPIPVQPSGRVNPFDLIGQ